MKATIPGLCLALTANSALVLADEGLDAYRQGDYTIAAQKITAAKTLDPIMQYYLGRMYLYGYGQEKDNKLAIQNIQNAAEKGLLTAQQIMGRYELIHENNPEQALYWFKKAANTGDMSAQMYCAAAYLFGFGAKLNPDLAKKYYITAAQHGNSIAQTQLADSFLETKQISNKKLGLIWLNKAVAQQNPNAQVMLAKLYINGTLVEKNLAQAKELLNLALKQGSVAAIYTMGELSQQEKNYTDAKTWYLKAAEKNYIPAYMALANLYSIPQTPLFDEHAAFLMTLKAAQSDLPEAQVALSNIYKNGRGTIANAELAAAWLKKSKQGVVNPDSRLSKVVQWLTLNQANQFANTDYRLNGIFTAWHNPGFLKEKQINPAPHMVEFSQQSLYQPKFVMLQPNEIPISAYYNALVSATAQEKQGLHLPRIKLALAATQHHEVNDNMFEFTEVAHNKLSIEERIKLLKARAVVGDPAAQLELGLRYQYGDGVQTSQEEAVKYLKLADLQHDVRARYQLAIMYLTDPGFTKSRKDGLDLMTQAALRGLPQAQYVLGQINQYGFDDVAIKKPINLDQAAELYKLASANKFGLAQYKLADLLVHQKPVDLTKDGLQQRYNLIKFLYQGAVSDGVNAAELPLAFYNAMDKDEKLRAQAFAVATKQAEAGNANAALLLALMYDRGIATKVDASRAQEWYKKAADTPVSEFVLGTYMSQGNFISKNLEQSKILLQKSADAGFMYAHYNLSVLKHELKEDFIPDLDQALNLGHSLSGVLLADYYVSLGDNKENLHKARDLYQRFAASGDQNSQLKLAYLCEQGLGGVIDWPQAGKWYQASAEQGNVVAQYLLGRLYQLGRLEKDPNIDFAHKWYAAASGKYMPAAVANGFLFDAFDDNYVNARNAYELAANKGDAVAQYNLALIYEGGKGIPVDLVKARELYEASAKQGYEPAVLRLKNNLSSVAQK
jgi:enhanced entry protein EnhC